MDGINRDPAPQKIVIIDDDRVALTMMETTLKKHGYQVFSAQDGAAGLALIQKEKPAVVISDMLIPKIHGIELCQEIKSDPALRSTKVILITAVYKGLAFKQDVDDSGADLCLKKPLDMKQIIELVTTLTKS
jgi:DNA-binding response OmpR family regulator